MLSPMAGARIEKGRTLRVVLDFDFRVGNLEHVEAGHGLKRQQFRVYFAAERVMEVYRYGRDEGWEHRWVAAPTWLRGAVDIPMFLEGGKPDAARRVAQAFRDGLRAFFRQFDPNTGRL